MNIAEDRAQRVPTLSATAEAPRWRRRHRGRRSCAVRHAVFASALVVAAPIGLSRAEDEAAPAAVPAAREAIPDGTAVRVLGRDVKGPSGEVVAQVVNVLVDGAGQPLAAVLDYGGFMGVGRRRIAVAWRALSFTPGGRPGGGGITLGLSRDQLKGFPDHKDSEPIVVAAPPEGAGGAEATTVDAPAPDAATR